MTTRALAVALKINQPIDLTNDSFNPAKSWFVHIPVLFPCGRSEILPLLCLPELPDQPKATNTRLPEMLYRHQLGKYSYIIRGRIHRKFALIFLQIFPQIFAQIFFSKNLHKCFQKYLRKNFETQNFCANNCAKICKKNFTIFFTPKNFR